MITYRKVTSSWVEGYGFNSVTKTLYVGTKGNYYAVTGLDDGDIVALMNTNTSGISVGSLVGKLFNKGTTVQVDWAVLEAALGPATAAQQSAFTKMAASMQNFAESLLPQARQGLFSI